MTLKRRQFSREFKLRILAEVESGKTIAQVAREHQIHPITITKWRKDHHSDRGVQYAAAEYAELLRANGLRISMSRKGNPYDNAWAESFIKTIKYEEVHLFEYSGFDHAQARIGLFLEDVYNQKRLHSALGYLPPAEFESLITNGLEFVPESFQHGFSTFQQVDAKK